MAPVNPSFDYHPRHRAIIFPNRTFGHPDSSKDESPCIIFDEGAMCLEVHFSRDDAAPDVGGGEVVFNLSICSFVRQAWKKLCKGPFIKDVRMEGRGIAPKADVVIEVA